MSPLCSLSRRSLPLQQLEGRSSQDFQGLQSPIGASPSKLDRNETVGETIKTWAGKHQGRSSLMTGTSVIVIVMFALQFLFNPWTNRS